LQKTTTDLARKHNDMSRYGGNGSHWDGCEEQHIDCMLEKVRREKADTEQRLNSALTGLVLISQGMRDPEEYAKGLLKELEEDGS